MLRRHFVFKARVEAALGNTTVKLTAVGSAADLEATVNTTKGTCSFGVVFDALDLASATASYALRFTTVPGGYSNQFSLLNQQNKETWHTDRAFPSVVLNVGPRISLVSDRNIDRFGAEPNYPGNGFLTAQYYINSALVHQFATTRAAVDAVDADAAVAKLQGVTMQRFPFPQWTDNTFATLIKALLPLFLTLSLLLTAMFIVKSVVEEKESRLKETFRMLGISASVQWAAWFFQYFIFMSISMTLVTLILGGVLDKSDGSLIFVFLMLFATASITFMFMVSVFFTQASTAAAAGAVIWFMSYVPYRFLTPSWALLTPGDKALACLFSTTCMSIGANVIGEQEGFGGGVTWDNMYDDISADDHFTFATVLQMLMVDTVLYMVLTLYLEAVWPSELGIPKPWYFPLLPSYWTGCFGFLLGASRSGSGTTKYSVLADGVDDDDGNEDGGGPDSRYFEPAPETSETGLRMSGLRKVFTSWRGPSKEAVVGTTLDLLQGEITVLLGHNGAGKTTTMSMLSGLIPPTAGTATINGHDICTDLRRAQSQLGLCPQTNTLIPSMTVIEHLWLFSKLKGVSDKHVYRYIDQMLEDIQLVPKRHEPTKKLSGGMKRKLSCALALVGQSPVVMLDEPTSGVDPSARDAIHRLLRKYREGRTILLSTHHMDEADKVADRIAIMNDGRVACCGTKLFLKSRYDIGYRLNMVVDRERCDVDALARTIQRVVPKAILVNIVRSDLSFVLPRDASPAFEALFTVLQAERSSLGVQSYGMAGASVADVFLKVGEQSGGMQPGRDNELEQAEAPDLAAAAVEALPPSIDTGTKLTGMALLQTQVWAMLVKRFLHLRRNYLAVVSQLLVPSFFTLMALLIAESYPSSQPSPSRDLTDLAGHYGGVNVLMGSDALAGASSWSQAAGATLKAATVQRNRYGARDLNASLYNLNQYCANGRDDRSASCTTAPSDIVSWAAEIALFNRKTLMAFDRKAPKEPRVVAIAACTDDGAGWRLQGDGTVMQVRQTRNSSRCLAAPTNAVGDSLRLMTVACGWGSQEQQWVYHTVALNQPTGPFLEHSLVASRPTDGHRDEGPMCAQTRPDSGGGGGGSSSSSMVDLRACCNASDTTMPCTILAQQFTWNNATGFLQSVASPDLCLVESAEIDPSQFDLTAYFNGQAYHTPAEVFAYASNAILAESLPGPSAPRISTRNYPLPRSADEELAAASNNGLGLSVALMMLFGMSFLVAFFTVLPVIERVTKAKHMQLLSGVQIAVFWGSSLAFDAANLLLPTIINVILFAAFDYEAFAGDRLGTIFVLFMVYGFASIPMMYVWSFMFDKPASAFSFAVLFNVLTGVIAVFTIFAVSSFPDQEDLTDSLKQFFMIFPNFCFGQSFVDMYRNYTVKQYLGVISDDPIIKALLAIYKIDSITCSNMADIISKMPQIGNTLSTQTLCQDNDLAMDFPGIGSHLLALAIQGLVCVGLLLVIEYNLVTAAIRYITASLALEGTGPARGPLSINNTDTVEALGQTDEDGPSHLQHYREDDDVAKERERVTQDIYDDDQEDIVVLKELKKRYRQPWGAGSVDAVQGVSLGVQKGTCFGLLGVNGAGKTTTFKMLTGDVAISNGTATLDGFDVATELARARQRVGYAPQFDALIDLMTGRELLTMYARLRGMQAGLIDAEVDRLVDCLRITKHADRLTKTYSGGNKRKLSTALALIGGPPIVLLDEPTSGMDPLARRALWRVLMQAMKSGQTIILTSHSMDECDALCSTLAIMVNGVFKCFGSPQHLKTKFSNGYSIEVMVADERGGDAAVDFVTASFPSAALEDKQATTVNFRLQEEDTELSRVFAAMEAGRQNGVLLDYSVSQTTLEEVFKTFAEDQRDVEDREEEYRNWTADVADAAAGDLAPVPEHALNG